jgi:streptomycin 6-kinase
VRAVEVQPTFRAFVARNLGDEGERWLAGLPALVAELADAWELALGSELPGGVLALVREAATADGREAVLKVAGPWDRTADEARCLRLWAGGAAPELLGADPARGALLLERIRPGMAARNAGPVAVASVLRALRASPPPGLRALRDVARRRVERAAARGNRRRDEADRALAVVDALEAEAPPPVLLHGDFDERNLLVCEHRGLAAIDPLPCAGDPAYDAAYWAHANGRPGRRERQHAIADALGLDPARVAAWGRVIAVHG